MGGWLTLEFFFLSITGFFLFFEYNQVGFDLTAYGKKAGNFLWERVEKKRREKRGTRSIKTWKQVFKTTLSA